MTAQQQQQIEVAFKTRGQIPVGLLAECFGLIVEFVRALINKKKTAPPSERHEDLKWLIEQVILPGMQVQGEKLAEVGEALLQLRAGFNKLKAQIAAA